MSTAHKSHRLLNKTPSARLGLLTVLMSCWSRKSSGSTKQHRLLAIVLDCSLELAGKYQLVKTQDLVIGHGEIRLELSCKFCLCLLSFIVPEDAIQATW